MFNFRLFAVLVVVLLVLAAGVLVWDVSAVKTTNASPTRSPNGSRLLELERLNDADNLKRGSDISPLPWSGQEEGRDAEWRSGNQSRR